MNQNRRFPLRSIIKENSFVIGILYVILISELAPWIGAKEGPLKPEITVKYLAVAIIFFTSGLTLEHKEFGEAVRNYKLHIFIQIYNFFLTPLIIKIFLYFFVTPFDLSSWIIKGIITVGCMPPSIPSTVVLTKAVGGNEATAILNSAVGTLLGIILTPLLLLIYVGFASTIPIISVIIQTLQTVILPILIGQLIRLTVNKTFLSRIPFSLVGQYALLFIIYSSFCDLFMQNDYEVDAHHILLTIFIVAVIQILLILICISVTKFFSHKSGLYTDKDIITIIFCSTHKSLTLGLPLLKTLYSGYSHLHQISLPLLVYNPMQLILGGLLVSYGQKIISSKTKMYTIEDMLYRNHK